MSYAEHRTFAIEAVERASDICRAVQANLLPEVALAKKDQSPVTVADFGVQAVVTSVLRRHFPQIPLVGEEDAAQLRAPDNATLCDRVVQQTQRIIPELDPDEVLDLIDHGVYEGGGEGLHWTLDPIDGTKGFLRRDQYAIALALIEDGEVVLGVLGCPNMPRDASRPEGEKGCLFVAVKGEAAFQRPLSGGHEEPIHVTSIRDPAKASFCESVEAEHSSQSDSARAAELLGITLPPFRIDSQCKYAAVARGDASIYLRLPARKDYEEKIWDHAAGLRVIVEAGGRVTDVLGHDLDFSLGRTLRENTGVIVTNGHVHDRVVAAVREVLAL